MDLHWACLPFDALGVHALYDCLALRQRVFILEQGPYMDVDGHDAHCHHLLGRDAQGQALAYLRIVRPGVKYAEASLGRVVTAPQVRGSGLGHTLVARGVAECLRLHPGAGIRISAQAHLCKFYARHGFLSEGPNHIEDSIPHQIMVHCR